MEREGSLRHARFLLVALALVVAVLAVAGRGPGVTSASLTASPASEGAQDQLGQTRLFSLTARKYAFNPPRIEVYAGDLVKITLEAQDIPHSFTIDAYRIAKRAAPGRPAVFEFRADQPGTFPYYCNLTIDEGCRQMRGELVVRPRPKG